MLPVYGFNKIDMVWLIWYGVPYFLRQNILLASPDEREIANFDSGTNCLQEELQTFFEKHLQTAIHLFVVLGFGIQIFNKTCPSNVCTRLGCILGFAQRSTIAGAFRTTFSV